MLKYGQENIHIFTLKKFVCAKVSLALSDMCCSLVCDCDIPWSYSLLLLLLFFVLFCFVVVVTHEKS